LTQILTAKSMKVTVVLDPAEVARLEAPDGKPRVAIGIRLPDRRVSVDLSAKSVRKAIVAIREHGPDNVAAIIQGKLAGDIITGAGLVAQAKVKPPEVVS
jgi:hypothetical protein